MTAEITRIPIVLLCDDGSEILWWPSAMPVGTLRLPVLTMWGYGVKNFEMDPSADRLTYREKVVLG